MPRKTKTFNERLAASEPKALKRLVAVRDGLLNYTRSVLGDEATCQLTWFNSAGFHVAIHVPAPEDGYSPFSLDIRMLDLERLRDFTTTTLDLVWSSGDAEALGSAGGD